MEQQQQYANTQADGLDNIAPTALQGQQAWQYAQSDRFLSPEEATAVLQKQMEPFRAQLEEKLSQIGYPPEHLATRPDVRDALFSGQQTGQMAILLGPDLQMQGRLRIVMTESGPDIRITPVNQQLTIPDEIGGVRLSKGEKQQLADEGALSRPLMIAENGNYVPTFLRVDKDSNTVELWRVRPELLPTKLMGIDLTKDQQLQLASGHSVRLTGLLDKQGEPFNATVSISPTQKGLQFSDVSRLANTLKPDEGFRNQLAHNNEGAKTDLTRGREIATGQAATGSFLQEASEDKAIKIRR